MARKKKNKRTNKKKVQNAAEEVAVTTQEAGEEAIEASEPEAEPSEEVEPEAESSGDTEASEEAEADEGAEASEDAEGDEKAQDDQTIGDLVAALADEGEAIDIADLADVVASVSDPAAMEERAKEAGVELVASLPIDEQDDLSEVEGEASERLMSIIESLLFAATKPLTVARIRKILKEPTVRQVKLALKELIAKSAHRGVCVVQVAGGFLLRTHPDNAQWVQSLLQARPVRLSRPQLETMAIISYRQPITKPEVDHVRGVDSGAVIKLLLEKDLIKIVGKKEEPGRPMLYGTTVYFLEFFNLMSLRDLPDLREFRELSDGTKELLATKMGEDEVEALGQEVLDFSDKAEAEARDKAAAEAAESAEDGGEEAGEGEEQDAQPRAAGASETSESAADPTGEEEGDAPGPAESEPEPDAKAESGEEE